MNKKVLIQHFIQQITQELELLIQAAKNTYDYATSEENKPENKYDTRGLEASYLAGAQAQRVQEMRDVLVVLGSYQIKNFTEKDIIGATALVELVCEGKSSFVLIMPKGGGQSVQFQGKLVQIITPNSPLGTALVGKKTGDVADVRLNAKVKEYEIIAVQ